MIRITRPDCPNPTSLTNGNYKHPDNKGALVKASHDKCMYCESKISHVYHGDVEHIKPKSKYPALKFEWTNLGYVCAICNGVKSNKFDEHTPFINPYKEDPEEHLIAFGAILRHKKGSERGEITIDQTNGIGLNRTSVVERRKEKMNSIEKAIDSCFRTSNPQLKDDALNALLKECEADKEYSLCIKALLKSHEIL